jgi:signal transduction histidine kinase
MAWIQPNRAELSSKRAFVLFGIVLVLLVAVGIAGFKVANRGSESREWVIHTFQVQSAIQDIRLQLSRVAGSRRNYLLLGDPSYAKEFNTAAQASVEAVRRVRQLTSDNPEQQSRVDRVETLVQERLGLLRNSIERHDRLHELLQDQTQIELTNIRINEETIGLLQTMLEAEQQLLQQRQSTAQRSYDGMIAVLVVSFLLATGLLVSNFMLLYRELKRRRATEKTLREVGESYRRLSRRVLEMQDQERRRLARELHDSAGQYLASVKMNLSRLTSSETIDPQDKQLLADALQWLDRTIAEVRTVSHLLHPPMLDEVGFMAATRWYIEEFANRSGIRVDIKMPDGAGRLPAETELVLFRVLQESLTNVHRHSGAREVEVRFARARAEVELVLRDDGMGMPAEALEKFRTGLGMGVGLSGMRERVTELGGMMSVDSSAAGTTLAVRLPAPGLMADAGAAQAS